MLPCPVIDCGSFSVAPINQPSRATLFSLSSRSHKIASLSFQSLAHASQFTYCDISSIFLALRTVCEKHPGVRLASAAKNPCAPLAPTKSISFLSFPRNSNGLYLFQNTHPPTSLESYSFTKPGVRWGWQAPPNLFRTYLRVDKPTSLDPSLLLRRRIAPARGSQRGSGSFRYFPSSPPHCFAFRTAFALHPAFCYRRRRRGKTFDVCK